MGLSLESQERSNRIRNFILKNYPNDKISEIKCSFCKGSGLDNFSSHTSENNNNYYFWDAQSICENCKGIGFINNINIKNIIFSCKACNGTGINTNKYEATDEYGNCNLCNGTGFIDWIQNIWSCEK